MYRYWTCDWELMSDQSRDYGVDDKTKKHIIYECHFLPLPYGVPCLYHSNGYKGLERLCPQGVGDNLIIC